MATDRSGGVLPYSYEVYGDLVKYLQERDGIQTDNFFLGAKGFLDIRERGLLIPNFTSVRVCRSPVPDLMYVVNSDFLLESAGEGRMNMSAIGAKKGIYDPSVVLENIYWSIYNLNLPED